MNGRLVLAVDGGTSDAMAIRWVLARAEREPLDIEVTTVLEDIQWPAFAEDRERARRTTRLEHVARRLRATGPGSDVTVRLRVGDLPHELLAATAHGATLVVGMTYVDSIDEALHLPLGLRLAGRTGGVLVIVPTAWRPGAHGVVLAWNADAAGEPALELAAAEARRDGDPLVIVHAGPLPRELTAAVERLRTAHPEAPVEVQHVDERPDDAVLRAAQRAALVVVGSHGKTALSDLLIGSVSARIMASSPVPVAVVPVPDEPIAVAPDVPDETF